MSDFLLKQEISENSAKIIIIRLLKVEGDSLVSLNSNFKVITDIALDYFQKNKDNNPP